MRHPSAIGRMHAPLRLYGRRVMMRPLVPSDHGDWSGVRRSNEDWLVPWEPQRAAGQPDLPRRSAAFTARCTARDRVRKAVAAYAFGLFVDQRFAGEVNLNNI